MAVGMLRSSVEIDSRRLPGPAPKPALPAVLAKRARWLVLIAAALWLYAAWAPWAQECPLSPEFPCTYMSYVYPIGFRPFATSALGWALDPVAWGALTPSGLLIAICLWSRRFGMVARIAFALWLLAMVGATAVAMSAWTTFVPSEPNTRVSAGAGVYALVIVVGLLLGAAVCFVIYFVRRGQHRYEVRAESNRSTAGAATPTRPSTEGSGRRLQIAGALTLSMGIACWAYSWLFLLWSPAQDPYYCYQEPLQDCLGLSAARAMELDGIRFISTFDPAIFHFAFPVLLVGGAVIALYVAWIPRFCPRFWLGIACWLVLAAWAYSLAISGTNEFLSGIGVNGFGLITFAPGAVTPEFLAGFGVGVSFASLIPLFAVLYQRPRRRNDTAESAVV